MWVLKLCYILIHSVKKAFYEVYKFLMPVVRRRPKSYSHSITIKGDESDLESFISVFYSDSEERVAFESIIHPCDSVKYFKPARRAEKESEREGFFDYLSIMNAPRRFLSDLFYLFIGFIAVRYGEEENWYMNNWDSRFYSEGTLIESVSDREYLISFTTFDGGCEAIEREVYKLVYNNKYNLIIDWKRESI